MQRLKLKDAKPLARVSREVALLIATCTLLSCATVRPDDALRVVTGMVSHNMCSEVFVSGIPADRVYAEGLGQRPGMCLINWATRYEVNREQGEVKTTVAGRFESRASYRPGLGCVVVRDVPPNSIAADFAATSSAAPLLPDIAGSAVVEPENEDLRAALDGAFKEPGNPPSRRTRAVVVLHDGRIVAERYAPGFGVDSPLLGYSATKSVTSALIGILVGRGQLAVDGPAPVSAWSRSDDPRRLITVDQLLRMTSGLDLDEVGSPFEAVARMLYLESDAAAFAEAAALRALPGSTWSYSSGNAIILSRIIRDAVGGRTEDFFRFARRQLFDPLGMRNVTFEVDATGTPLGSTYMLAPARDWARFGMLYLNDGVVAGQRILPEGWVSYSTQPTLDTGYGAGWWTNRVAGHIPWSSVVWSIPGAPSDSFYARGLLGQYIVVVPSARLVVVRLGASDAPDYDIDGVGKLVASTIKALNQRVPDAADENETAP
ncbi:MAG TPA: serine hydrolase [Candidatus Acidoferrales bacterium]|nr:serine hydrolase [Candidatus Acidoferrales bacterium]